MIILGIDTSSTELSIGILKNGNPLISFSRYAKNYHAEHIAGIFKFAMNSADLDMSDITHVGVSCGPGSFTGLRIGISFIKGLFLTKNTPVLPVSSLHSMAESFMAREKTLFAVINARQDQVFCAKFEVKEKGIERVTDDELMPADSFYSLYTEGDVVVIDTLGYKKGMSFKLPDNNISLFSSETLLLQRGLACARIAASSADNENLWKKAIDIIPNYMQKSYAEKKDEKNLLLKPEE